jgi:hypothetical protein
MTTPHRRRQIALGLGLTILGILYAALPLDWIEQQWHVSPDGDSGLIEVLVPIMLCVAGTALLLRVFLSTRSSVRRTEEP